MRRERGGLRHGSAMSAPADQRRPHARGSPSMLADCIITNAAEVITCAGPAPKRGAGQADARPIPHAGRRLARRPHRVRGVGGETCAREVEPATGCTVIDAAGCAVVPGFVDAHTHLVFAGDRRDELRRRLAGATYAEHRGRRRRHPADRPGDPRLQRGSYWLPTRASASTRCCGAARRRARSKSGYGLTTESELKLLRVIRRLAEEGPIELVPTFMGAHEIPPEYRDRRRRLRAPDHRRDDPARRGRGAGGVVRRVLRDRRVHGRRSRARSSCGPAPPGSSRGSTPTSSDRAAAPGSRRNCRRGRPIT